jgi:hypothetical protein
MTANKRDVAQGQDPDSDGHPYEHDELAPNTGGGENTESADIPRPLTAIRRYCVWCCNGSAMEVRLCPAIGCSLWPNRFGRKPTPDMLAEAGDCQMYPLEDPMTAAQFHENGGTPLKAIKRRCLDCSGYSKADVRNCFDAACALYPFRQRRNPNRRMNPEQRKAAAARLKANIERGKEKKRGDDEPKPDLQDPST